jgi:hypothetical protein
MQAMPPRSTDWSHGHMRPYQEHGAPRSAGASTNDAVKSTNVSPIGSGHRAGCGSWFLPVPSRGSAHRRTSAIGGINSRPLQGSPRARRRGILLTTRFSGVDEARSSCR